MGISENKQRNACMLFFYFVFGIQQSKYFFNQVSWSYLHIHGNYCPLSFEPILVKIASFLAQNELKAKIGEVWKLPCKLTLWVYTYITTKHNTIYIFGKKQTSFQNPVMSKVNGVYLKITFFFTSTQTFANAEVGEIAKKVYVLQL